ncbi:MAG TPA: LutB/LldF family L-lactate oxidation iron-sulfur protein [Dissulfurispiraceae bacterium]|nr:LutB/LldF family L-lactate oxidation iron-sulfur protein [Dissulfurispiraceae bacterium]
MNRQGSLKFRADAARAIADTSLHIALKKATGTFSSRRAEAVSSVEDFESLREQASSIRQNVLDNMKSYLEMFTSNAEKAGASVHHAVDAAAARRTVADILSSRGAKRVVKGKSMVCREIQLGEYIEKQGMEVVETAFGEYIVQLEKGSPSHIIVPDIHKDRKQIGSLFAEKLGVEYSEDPRDLAKTAGKVLREKFLTADAGISGANFAIAESGSLVIFTNEGNGRMVATMPPLHIAVVSIEKLLPLMKDLPVFMRLLPRSATGQEMTSYMSIITGSRKAGEPTGAKELHIVLVDNGRSEILSDECREILKCIKCGACINVCPVYRTIGGHTYGGTYPGPMGIILTVLLTGLAKSHHLVDASTFCGACDEVCPVKIPLVELIHKLRVRRVAEGFSPVKEKLGMRVFEAAARSPFLFSSGEGLAKIFWPVLSSLGGEDIAGRLPDPVKMPFRRRME